MTNYISVPAYDFVCINSSNILKHFENYAWREYKLWYYPYVLYLSLTSDEKNLALLLDFNYVDVAFWNENYDKSEKEIRAEFILCRSLDELQRFMLSFEKVKIIIHEIVPF